MKSMFKGVALLVAVACVVWIAVLWHWRSAGRQVDAADMAIYLGALPLVVFGLLLAGRWAVKGAMERQASRSTSAATGSGDAGARGGSAEAEPSGHAPVVKAWHVLGQWMQVPAGMDASAALEAVVAGEPRPAPDAQLRDDEGLPILAARTSDLAVDAIAEALPSANEEVHRTLALMNPMMGQWIDHLRQWSDRFLTTDVEGRPKEPHRIRVLVAWPAHWREQDAEESQRWLANELAKQTGEDFGPEIWSLQTTRSTGAEMLLAADKLLDTLQKQGRDDLVLLVGCHSDINDMAVRRLERENRLFHGARRPKGQMPGEGAAAVLLSTQAWPLEDDDALANLVLTRPRAIRRDQSIDQTGRVTAREAQQITVGSLALAGLQPDAIKSLVCDADQHTPRATELFAVSLEQFPQLDPIEDMRLLGTLTGTLGSSAPLATLAAAIAWSAQDERLPVMAMSMGDTHWRVGSVLHRPLPSEPEASTSSA